MKKLMAAGILAILMSGAAGCGLFERGPDGEPSPMEAGFKAGAESAQKVPSFGNPLIDLIAKIGIGVGAAVPVIVSQKNTIAKLKGAKK